MIGMTMTVLEGQDIPARLGRFADVEIHAAMLRTATGLRDLYLPQLRRDAPSGHQRHAGEPKLRDSFSAHILDVGVSVSVEFYTNQIQKLTWVTQGTEVHVILPVERRALKFENGDFRAWAATGITHKNPFLERIKARIRTYASYYMGQQVSISVQNI